MWNWVIQIGKKSYLDLIIVWKSTHEYKTIGRDNFQFSQSLWNYINGKSICNTDVIEQNIYPLVATKLAQMHKIPVKTKQNVLWSRMKNFIDLVPDFQNEDESNWLKSKQDLVVEFNFLKSLLEDCSSPLVFCHLDLNLPNILFDGAQRRCHHLVNT